MISKAIFTLLHDAWGDSYNESIRLVSMRISADNLINLNTTALSNIIPEIPHKRWQIWKSYYSDERLKQREYYLLQNRIDVFLYSDLYYPEKLKSVYQPPAILYIKGNLPSSLSIGIVGSRKATVYGRDVAYTMAKALSREQICIISGLAKGIDANAHKGAIEAEGGTVGVLGCGIDQIYPKENKWLYDGVLKHRNGAIISEWSLGSSALAYHFPRRNRIISGLSDGILVVEAAAKSGSLITANYALENGKDVFAIPGMITSAASVGCHRLIKDGAKLVASPNDILEEFGQLSLFREVPNKMEGVLTHEEQCIMDILTGVPQHIEYICEESKLPIHRVNSILTELELKELVVQHIGRQYSKIEV